MRLLLIPTLLLLCGSPALLGVLLARRRPAWTTSLTAVATALLLFRGALAQFPGLALRLFPYDWYPAVETWWSLPVIGFLFAVAFSRLRTRPIKLASAAVLTLATLYALWGAWGEGTARPEDLTGVPGPDGICPQTTGYSCGAAAAATLATLHGIPATERQLAGHAHTTPWGTSATALAIALRHVSGASWECGKRDPEWALARPLPCLVTIAFSPLVDHWVVLSRLEGGKVELLDPLVGRRELSEDEFRRLFRGAAVWRE